jgi:hypothetical protein
MPRTISHHVDLRISQNRIQKYSPWRQLAVPPLLFVETRILQRKIYTTEGQHRAVRPWIATNLASIANSVTNIKRDFAGSMSFNDM